ncbi:hypothetical protein M2146_002497 [Lachnospiraceae bacterium PF1-22]
MNDKKHKEIQEKNKLEKKEFICSLISIILFILIDILFVIAYIQNYHYFQEHILSFVFFASASLCAQLFNINIPEIFSPKSEDLE